MKKGSLHFGRDDRCLDPWVEEHQLNIVDVEAGGEAKTQ